MWNLSNSAPQQSTIYSIQPTLQVCYASIYHNTDVCQQYITTWFILLVSNIT